ncbi:CBS domain-containing protein [Lentzea flaviverrucosa]|uniref:CBS domain-containing protein n=1 Tax=Lentzea flaviverrucosa TaxID=200379 RepID=A0A1H9XWL2_9PSEU|nr:CBS domain-containing protein [Lentzea flaviverrucosa]RDI34298.1 CBS domain protein [Lentzea flaviverrucosa]SES50531.1 CBS domain-containing protein [Lentzea flaviverrucosa]
MREPTVSSLMTREVISADIDSSFKELVQLLEGNKISALPVLDGGYPVGVVSEADLVPKEEFRGGTEDAPGLFGGRAARHRWEQAAGLTAKDVMTSPVRSISPDATASAAARELAEAGVRRLFVMDGDGALVGVLSRRDLLKLYLREDDELRTTIRDEIFGRTLWVDPDTVDVEVTDGVVALQGRLERQSEIDIADHLVRALPGVVDVQNRLRPEWNDTTLPRQTEIFG